MKRDRDTNRDTHRDAYRDRDTYIQRDRERDRPKSSYVHPHPPPPHSASYGVKRVRPDTEERWRPEHRQEDERDRNRDRDRDRDKDKSREKEKEKEKEVKNGVSSPSAVPAPVVSSVVSQNGASSVTLESRSPDLSVAVDAESVHDDDEDADGREQRELEERRKRREQILAKHQNTQSTAENNNRTNKTQVGTTTATTTEAITAGPVSAPALPRSAKPAEYDMFSDSPSLLSPHTRLTAVTSAAPSSLAAASAGELFDSWDDAEGYYKYRLGDIITDTHNNRQYRVCGLQGSGVFSTVLRVKVLPSSGPSSTDTDLISGSPAASGASDGETELVIKVIRNNETMFKAGMKEVEFLRTLANADPSHRKHVIHLLHHFIHRNHLCLLFPPYAMDLRKVVKKFGSVGLSLSAVRLYAQQLLIALRLLQKCAIVHGDIKPDNLLVSERMHVCAVCDFGSASWLQDCTITPYLVSRFYRAPEIMLGLPYHHAIDLWSVGCVLYELYTGKILFQGSSNNEMLYQQMEIKGKFPVKLLRQAQFAGQHFNSEGVFLLHRVDAATRATYQQPIHHTHTPIKDLYSMLKQHSGGTKDDASHNEYRKLKQLSDFIHQCLVLDQNKRPKLEDLLQHPFLKED